MAPALQPDVEHVRDLFEAFVLNGRERVLKGYLRLLENRIPILGQSIAHKLA